MLTRRLRHPEDVGSLKELFARCETHTSRPPLSERKYRALVADPATGTGFIVEEDGGPVGYVHVLISKRPGLYELELAVDPAFAGMVEETLLGEAMSQISQLGGDSACLWVYSPIAVGLLNQFGFARSRSLHQMRVSLPVAPAPDNPGLETRGFESGDERHLLALNNRAFLGHPEAGNLTLDDFRMRQRYEWYDQGGIRMAWKGERLAAFCWTKEHPHALGEIYLIATDPDLRGIGLGRAIALDGLRYLSDQKGCRTGMLFADGENRQALQMYESIGFRIHRTDTAYVAPINSSGSG